MNRSVRESSGSVVASSAADEAEHRCGGAAVAAQAGQDKVNVAKLSRGR